MRSKGAWPKTKIICTLGPSSNSEETIVALIDAGMSVARLNLSHGDLEQHAAVAATVRRTAASRDVAVGVMVDVPGPKYRTGSIGSGTVQVQPGDSLTLTSRQVVGAGDVLPVAPPGIHRDAEVGGRVLLDDGLIELIVRTVDGDDVVCEVVTAGSVGANKGVTTPGKTPSQPYLSDQTKEALRFAAQHHAEFVALSTVTSHENVRAARHVLEVDAFRPYIVSKIERAEALEDFDRILEASDAIMVARGDLGVERRLAEIPPIQKDLIARCNNAGKPVITATQMLESMLQSPVPTRAEVSDVANAVLDGTDAVMLSGETSIGRYPVEAVHTMAEVALEAESALPYESMIIEKRHQLLSQTDDAIAYDACQTAYQINASLIVAFTESGSTADRVSKYRPQTHILALSPSEATSQRLTLRWGVTPMTVPQFETVDELFAIGEEKAANTPWVDPGSRVVLVAGLPIGVPGGTNLLRVLTLSE